MLDQEITADEIRGILEVKQAELEEQIQAAQRRLARVEAHLRQIDMEGKMPDHEVLLKTVQAQWVASVREKMSWSGQDVLGPNITKMFDEVGEHLDRQRVDSRLAQESRCGTRASSSIPTSTKKRWMWKRPFRLTDPCRRAAV